MANASGSQMESLIWSESTWGASPSAVAARVLPLVENNLEIKRDSLKSNTLNKNRQPRANRSGLKQVDGDIKFEFSYKDFDEILESAFQGVFTNDVLKSASTPKYLGIEKGFTDVNVYNKYLGLGVDEFSLEIKPNSVITGSAKFVGKTMETSGSSANTSASSSYGFEPFDSFTGEILEGNTAIAIVTGLSLNVKNGLKASEAVFANTAIGITSDTLEVTGKVDVFLTDGTMQGKFLNETESSLEFTLRDTSANEYTFTMPSLKYTSGDPNGKAGDVIQTLNFSAAYDATSNTTISVTR